MTKKLLFIILPLIALLSYSCQNKKIRKSRLPTNQELSLIRTWGAILMMYLPFK